MSKTKPAPLDAVRQALDAYEKSVRDAMRQALDESRRDSADATNDVHDLGDESVADALLSLNGALAERHGRELRMVEEAHRRLAEGTINDCLDCGGEIGLPRLHANPVAQRCITCESRREHSGAYTATPRL